MKPKPKITKTTLNHKKLDAVYWRKRSYTEHQAALEEICQEYHQWKYDGEPRMKKVIKIIRLNRDYNDGQ